MIAKVKIIIISVFFLLSHITSSVAQKVDEEKIKAVFVYNFMKHTIWPNEDTKQGFTIAVYKDNNFYNTLSSLLLDKQLRNKPIYLIQSANLDDVKAADVAIIPESSNLKLEEIAFQLRRSETLLVTQNSVSKKDVMINFINLRDISSLSFEINKSNLLYEQLVISGELLLLGGTELDVATLYRETELAMQEIKLRESAMQQNIASLQEQLSAASSNLEQSTNRLKNNNLALQQKEKELKIKGAELTQLQLKAEQQQQSFSDIEQELTVLSKQRDIAFSQSQKILEQKNTEVREKESQINQLGGKISQNKAEIDQQLQQLKKQRAEINNKNQTIKSKNTYLTITVAFIIIVLIFTILVALLFMRNRKVTAELQQTLKNLENTQSQLVQSEKMASLGLLTAGISHEINTPIGIVVTSLSIIQEKVTELVAKISENKLTKSKLDNSLVYILESADVSNKSLSRVTTLISNFKQVAVDHVVEEPREINLGKYISEILNTLSSQLKKRDVHYSSIDNHLITMVTIPGALAQVLTNLITNTINHAFADKNQTDAKINIELVKKSQYEIIIIFSDNGCGMSQDVLDKIYEPFYTTKRSEGGTGLGMNIVYNIVLQKLKGTIDIQSAENVGTTVTLNLPTFIKSNPEI